MRIGNAWTPLDAEAAPDGDIMLPNPVLVLLLLPEEAKRTGSDRKENGVKRSAPSLHA